MWNHVVVEGYCFGEKHGKHPCGRRAPSPFCLVEDKCPHFAWTDSNEREAAQFVPFRLILWDRVQAWVYGAWESVSWFFWGQLWFNKRKVDEFFANIKTISAKDCPQLAEWEDGQKKNEVDFKTWFKKAKKGW